MRRSSTAAALDDDRRRRRRPTATTAGDGAARPVGDGDGGVALEKIGDFDQPALRHPAAPATTTHLYVVEQGGPIQRVAGDGGEPEPFLDISDLVTCGGEQGLLSVAFAPDYAELGPASTSTTPTRAGDSRIGRVPALGGRPGGRRSRQRPRAPARSTSLRPQPQRRPAAVRPRRRALHRHRRRRRRRRPRAHGPGPRQPARQDPADRPAPDGALHVPTTTRSSTTGRGPRSTPTACATRGASPSTARPATCRSATSARTRSRRSTSCGARRGLGGAQLRLVGVRGRPALQRRPGGARTRSRRCSTTAATRAARSPAATSSATRELASLYGRYLYGDFCARRAAQLHRRARRARRRTTARSGSSRRS